MTRCSGVSVPNNQSPGIGPTWNSYGSASRDHLGPLSLLDFSQAVAEAPSPFGEGEGGRTGVFVPQRPPPHLTGTCFEYHDSGKCSRRECTFSHRCYRPNCNAEHAFFLCNRSDSRAPRASAPSSTKSHAPTQLESGSATKPALTGSK
jgi:hypothetical protein